MELTRIDDVAARQSIDSMRVYREFVRVRRELNALAGSLFWKKVGEYEYLAHKVGAGTKYKGARSESTEAQFKEYVAKMAKLKSRYESLKATVEASQRMNRAVHAGAVPAEVVDVLTQIEQRGLTERSLVVGTPALYAYSQSSGVSLKAVKLDGKALQVLESAPKCLRVLIQRPEKAESYALSELRRALSKFATIQVGRQKKSSEWVDLLIHFSPRKSKAMGRKTGSTSQVGMVSPDRKEGTSKAMSKAGADRVHACEMLKLWRVESEGSWQASEDRRLEQLLERTPGFEQVVVGKTGKMAVMRTVDPRLFVSLERALHAVAASVKADEESELPVRLVEQMIDTSMVVTKLDEASTAALSEEVQNIVRDAVANGDSAGGITAVPESQP